MADKKWDDTKKDGKSALTNAKDAVVMKAQDIKAAAIQTASDLAKTATGTIEKAKVEANGKVAENAKTAAADQKKK